MKALFYALSLLVCGAAGFFSYQNLGKFQEQRSQKEQRLLDDKKMTKQGDDKDADLTKEKDTLATAKTNKATLEASVEQLAAAERRLRAEIATVNGNLEEQKAKFADLEKAREGIQLALKSISTLNLGGGPVELEDVPELATKIRAERDAKKAELAELETNVEGAQKNVKTNQAEIARLADRESERNARFRGNAMESVVTAVNNDWGFVVIGAGSSTGFTPQTKLLIKREGRLIGEVKPSSIEPSQTIAEIDDETIAPGARIQPGDRVILANPATN